MKRNFISNFEQNFPPISNLEARLSAQSDIFCQSFFFFSSDPLKKSENLVSWLNVRFSFEAMVQDHAGKSGHLTILCMKLFRSFRGLING